jgi:hypothetical protein
VVGEVPGVVVDELVVDEPFDRASVGASVAEGVPGVQQVGVLVVELVVLEPAKRAPPLQRSEEPAAGRRCRLTIG